MDAIDRALMKAMVHWFAFFDDYEDETVTPEAVDEQHEGLAEIFRELGVADRHEFVRRYEEHVRQVRSPRMRRVFEDFLDRMDLLGDAARE